MTTTGDNGPAAEAPGGGLSNGAWAQALLQRSLERLEPLQVSVLADDGDPEPLHRLRVAMRRLRTVRCQFAPALILPAALSERRIARIGRRLGQARDRDVLRERLKGELIPDLPEAEVRALRPLLRLLRRERRQAAAELAHILRGGSWRRLLEALRGWLEQPQLTPLGQEPLLPWLADWQLPSLQAISLHPGWFVAAIGADPAAVHDLRKRFKNARYALENLQPLNGEAAAGWISRFRELQDLLGELHDLEVLEQTLDQRLPGLKAGELPLLQARLQERMALLWARWRGQALELQQPLWRQRLRHDLLGGLAINPRRDVEAPLTRS